MSMYASARARTEIMDWWTLRDELATDAELLYSVKALLSADTDFRAGITPVIAVGDTKTLPEGSDATVDAVPAEDGVRLDFGIPKGETGDAGDYSTLRNLPSINGNRLAGDMTTAELGIVIPERTSELTNDSDFVTENRMSGALDGKVDKVSGKGLSANDFTDEEKAKLASLENYDDTALDGKVDKVSGKGLSANDFTDEEKAKLASLENYDDTALERRVSANETAIDTLSGTGTGSVSKTVDDRIAAVVADAPENFDTLKEISDWISGHAGDAAAMNSAIRQNDDAISKEVTARTEADATLARRLAASETALNALNADKQDVMQFNVMPNVADYAGKVIIYTGATSDIYTQGSLYFSDGKKWTLTSSASGGSIIPCNFNFNERDFVVEDDNVSLTHPIYEFESQEEFDAADKTDWPNGAVVHIKSQIEGDTPNTIAYIFDSNAAYEEVEDTIPDDVFVFIKNTESGSAINYDINSYISLQTYNSNSNYFVIPKDGYVICYSPESGDDDAGLLSAVNNMWLCNARSISDNGDYYFNSLFVKKGMKVYSQVPNNSCYVRYYPLEAY